MIMVEGNSWSSGDNWPTASDSAKYLTDPANNLMFEAHVYFDNNASGTYSQSYASDGATPQIGVTRVSHFISWCETNNKRGLIGEYGCPGNDANWATVLDNFLSYCNQHHVGGTYWSAGPWWGSYALSVEPSGNVDKSQMSILSKYTGTSTGVVQPAVIQNKIDRGVKIVRTEYYSINGQRLTVRNGKPVMAANSIIVVHDIDVSGMMHAGKMIAK